MEIGIVRLRLISASICATRCATPPNAIGRDRARITRRQARVGRGIARARPCPAARGSRRAWRASCRGAAAVRAGLSCPNTGLVLTQILERGDALASASDATADRDRCRGAKRACVGEALEGLVHALRRLAGGGEELHAGAVGLILPARADRRGACGGSSPAAPGSRPARRAGCAAGLRAGRDRAPTPSSRAMIAAVCALASCSRSFDR